MLDKEKVVKGLECLAQKQEPIANPCSKCDYHDRPNFAFCVVDVATDTLALLKEQEAVKPVRDTIARRFWVCGNCGEYVGFEDNDPFDFKEFDNYCRRCGRSVLWEGR